MLLLSPYTRYLASVSVLSLCGFLSQLPSGVFSLAEMQHQPALVRSLSEQNLALEAKLAS
jgi:hypothetical protein